MMNRSPEKTPLHEQKLKSTSNHLIEVREYGKSGPTVVLLHGGPGAPGSVASLARDLASDFRIREPLQRQSGNKTLTVEGHCLDLAAVAPERMLLVGWSWGAMLALSFASRYPARVSAVALVGCGAYDIPSRAIYQKTLDDRLGPKGRSRVAALQRKLQSETDGAKRDRLLAEVAEVVSRAQAFAADTRIKDALRVDSRGHEETWRDVLRLQREGIEPSGFRTITAPVIMLHGDDDPHPGTATRDVLRRCIPHLEYICFARCGHVPWAEPYARNAFLETLKNWLIDHST
jgi:pimeloyl-ACP methyl ester carboxylesterase